MLANVTCLCLENFSAGYWTFTERLFSCEINFSRWLFGFSFLFRLRVSLLEFEADIFLVVQHEKRFEWPALARNELLKQIRFAAREQFVHLFSLDWSLQNDFAGSEVARLVRAH